MKKNNINMNKMGEELEEIKKYKKHSFSSGTRTGEDFKEFTVKFKKFLLKIIPENAKLKNYSKGHYILSGFVEKNGYYLYISIPDVRYNKWYNDILIRSVENEEDYTGGGNSFTSLEDLEKDIKEYFEN